MNSKVRNAKADEPLDGAQAEHPEDVDAGEQNAQGAEPDAGVEADESVEKTVDPLEESQARVASLEESLLRAKADYQNLQRRCTQELSEAVRYANAEMMRSLLGVLDDFERALEAAETTDTNASVADGVRLVYDNLKKALWAHGLESIEAIGRPFDPHVHEAVMQQPSADHPPDAVLAEVAKGYSLRERVLRPAKVIVSKAVETAQGEDPELRHEEEVQEEGKRKKWKRKHRSA